jgi:hypothetical protein
MSEKVIYVAEPVKDGRLWCVEKTVRVTTNLQTKEGWELHTEDHTQRDYFQHRDAADLHVKALREIIYEQ